MKVALGNIGKETPDGFVRRINAFLRDIERAFNRVPEVVRSTYSVALNFAAPGAVPGVTTQSTTIEGAEVGDTVLVGAPIATPAGFIGPFAYVSAADTVIVLWAQLSGAPADPDGAGGDYQLDLWRH